MVPSQLLELLCCPRCGEPLNVDAPDGTGAGMSVACVNGHRFGAPAGYLDLAEGNEPAGLTGRTFASFGYEWNAFDDIRPEDEEYSRVYFRDLDVPSLQGKTGLDAGCGKGRYTRFLAAHLGALVALDGSSAVEAAARNLSSFPNVLVVKADLRAAPIAAGAMDFVSCLGVLHHLENPRAGFEKLVELLAPGGTLLLYLYSRPTGLGTRRAALATARAFRKLTVRLPHRVLRVLSEPVAALLYVGIVELGAFGDRAGFAALSRLPMASYRGKSFRSVVLDTFDRLSAPVEHRYVWSELEPWFAEAGLSVEAAREEAGWFIVARKSA